MLSLMRMLGMLLCLCVPAMATTSERVVEAFDLIVPALSHNAHDESKLTEVLDSATYSYSRARAGLDSVIHHSLSGTGTGISAVEVYQEERLPGGGRKQRIAWRNTKAGDSGSEVLHLFEKDDRMIRKETRSSQGLLETCTYRYDAKGKETEEVCRGKGGDTSTYAIKSYDSKGRLSKVVDGLVPRNSRQHLYTDFDSLVAIVRMVAPDEAMPELLLFFDSKKRPTREIRYGGGDSIPTQVRTFEYTSAGLKSKTRFFQDTSGSPIPDPRKFGLSHIESYQYDSRRRLTKRVLRGRPGFLP